VHAISTAQIRQVQGDAANDGDLDMVATCVAALAGDKEANAECATVVAWEWEMANESVCTGW